MKRLTISALFIGLLAAAWVFVYDAPTTAAAPSKHSNKVSGQGKFKFRVLYTSDHLPLEAQEVLKDAHGGFAIDRREDHGEIYFALPGAGIIQISGDLKTTRMVETPPEMKDTNMHNTTIWYAPDGAPFLTFPGVSVGKVFTTLLNGKLVHTLDAPKGKKNLGHPDVNNYFRGMGNFVPTDVEYLDGMLYVPTGYSHLDYVLTARVESTNPFEARWHDLAFGGKGGGVGEFGTAHGITVPRDKKRIDISDRPNSEIDRFTRYGHYLSTLKMPAGSWPCDVDYLDDYGVVGSLHGPDRGKGAPIYVLKDDRVVSAVMPKAELGLENFQHIHNAVLHEHDDKLYIITQAWNPGDFAILEQVDDD